MVNDLKVPPRDHDGYPAGKVLDSLSQALLLLDSRGSLLWINRSGEQLFGYARDRILGQNLALLVPECPQIHCLLQYGESARILGVDGALKCLGRSRNGQTLPIEMSVHSLETRGQETIRMCFIGIAEPIDSDQAGLQRRAKRTALAKTAVISMDCNGRIHACNGVAEGIFGYPFAQLAGHHLVSLCAADQGNRLRNELSHVLDRKVRREVALQMTTGSGEDFIARLALAPLKNPQDLVVGTLVQIEKIGKSGGDSVKPFAEHERLQAQILDQFHDCVISTDIEGHITSWNKGAERLFGHMQAEVIGRHISLLFAAEQRCFLEEEIFHTLKQTGSHELEIRMYRKTGEPLDAYLSLSVLTDQDGGVVGMIGYSKDITERKTAELRQNQYTSRLKILSQGLLEAAENERRSIARELHDEISQSLIAIQIKLQSINLNCGTLQADPRLNESIEIAEQLCHQVQKLSLYLHPAMLDDLGLAYAMKWFLKHVTLDSGLLVHFTTELYDIRFSQAVEIACFRVAQEAITNVLRHAMARSLNIELDLQDQNLLLTVIDDGTGFDLQSAQAIEPPHRTLGLLGMQERAALLGGGVQIASAPGQGTCIHGYFPVSVPSTTR